MSRYEVLMLTVPEITQDESRQLEDKLEKLVESFKGVVVSFERWGKFRLAYPVNKNDYGVYFLFRFEVGENAIALLDELKMMFAVKLNNLVMRHMTTRLDADASLAYQRPPALEETPGRDVDSFLRENKMEGLLSMEGKKAAELDEEEDFAAEEAAA